MNAAQVRILVLLLLIGAGYFVISTLLEAPLPDAVSDRGEIHAPSQPTNDPSPPPTAPAPTDGKPADGKGAAREIFSLELARTYSFDQDVPLQRVGTETTQWGPVTTLLRFDPGGPVRLRAQAVYNTEASVLTTSSLTAGFGLRGSQFEVTWLTRTSAQTKERLDSQARLWGTVPLLQRRLVLQGQVTYNLEQSFVQQQQLGLAYASQCWSMQVQAREFRAERGVVGTNRQVDRDRDIRLVLSLKNIGTFLDLSSRESTSNEN